MTLTLLQFGGNQDVLVLVLMVAVMFFFIIFPQIRRQKKEKKFQKELKKGTRIVTTSGIHGKLIEVSDSSSACVIETMAGKLKIEKSAISLDLTKQQETTSK